MNRVKNNLVCANKLVDILLEVKSESMKCKIVLIDGKNSETECVTYDVLTKQPSHLPKLSYHRCRPTSTKFGSKVFVFGGAENMKGRNPHKSCEMLNFNEQVKWVDMPDMTEARGACACGFIGNCIYVTGGFQNGALSSCEKFDLLGNKWMAINPMLQKRYGHATVVCDGSVYCIGGHDGNTCLASCERYDMNTEKWNEIAPLHKKRNYVAGVVLDNTIYAIVPQNRLKFMTQQQMFGQLPLNL
uniref:Kelch-like protein 12 n=1 Tax=Phallusia mammillata TaxID=59560 RepID=A0A6F9DG48_9ASCI|nr:kelch-like protein 12 [Phallusia mammillata]